MNDLLAAKVAALEPYGRALTDYHAGDTSACPIVHSDLGERDELPMEIFFREPDGLYPFEREALARCHGRVLDLGAGVGPHTLALQERGLEVCSVEALPQAAAILRDRGARDVIEADMRTVDVPPAETVLMLMNGPGPLGTLDGLAAFLSDAPRLLVPGGQLLLDSGTPVLREPSATSASFPPRDGEYPGEAWIRIEYRDTLGEPFRELYVDRGTLSEHAVAAGWRCETIHAGELDSYVVRLTRP